MPDFRRFFVLLVCLFCWLLALRPVTAAADDKILITVGPSWERFTNMDGHGLYHDLIGLVFADYQVKHIYVPTVQANSMVAIGRADIKLCETIEVDPLIIARVPMYENDFFALYLQKNIPQWEGARSLAGKKLVWREGYYTQADFSVPVDFLEVRNGESALKMVEYDRADLYIDDWNLIMQSFAAVGEKFEEAVFALQKVGTRKYYPVFARTERGEKLRQHYEEEMKRLYLAGTLQKVYDKWAFTVPDFSFNALGKQQTSEKEAHE